MVEMVMVANDCGGEGEGKVEEGQQQQQGQVLALVLAALRKSVVLPCQMADAEDPAGAAWGMEIGWPTDVHHVAHVTFDRLHGFLGLPAEFELEIPGQVPSASASVFGVSPESMQCSYDDKGNSVPKILLLMQERLYTQDGLKAEGIFRITPENSQEEHVREQLNSGIVPDDIDVHCLASLIKAWFRELPEGVLDSLSPEQVLHCNTEEEECIELVKLLHPTQAALLSWVVKLMTDVVEEEESNKMNARNVAMVFAPNMTQMSDPLIALMHAVQVMNLLKTLILKTLREREDDDAGAYSSFSSSPSLSHEVDEEDGNDLQEDRSDTGTAQYTDSDNRSPILKASALIVDNEQLIGVSRRHTSIDCHLPCIAYDTGDEDSSLNDIEECLLRRLEWKAVDKASNEDNSCKFPLYNKEADHPSSSLSTEESCMETTGTIIATVNELRQMEPRIEMTNADARGATKVELIPCS